VREASVELVAVTVYPVMALPPVLAGSAIDTAADVPLATTLKIEGADGLPTGRIEAPPCVINELEPPVVVTFAWMAYRVPFVRPEITTGDVVVSTVFISLRGVVASETYTVYLMKDPPARLIVVSVTVVAPSS
jgi:hypothetical protein